MLRAVQRRQSRVGRPRRLELLLEDMFREVLLPEVTPGVSEERFE